MSFLLYSYQGDAVKLAHQSAIGPFGACQFLCEVGVFRC